MTIGLPEANTSVLECQDEFKKLAHGVLLYNPAYDDTFFVTRFVSGLHKNIRSAILLHRPCDVDTLVLWQPFRNKNWSKGAPKSLGRISPKGQEVFCWLDKAKTQKLMINWLL